MARKRTFIGRTALCLAAVFGIGAVLAPTVAYDRLTQLPSDLENHTVNVGTARILDRSAMITAGRVQYLEDVPIEIVQDISTSGSSGGTVTVVGEKVTSRTDLTGTNAVLSHTVDTASIDRKARTVVAEPPPTFQSSPSAEAVPSSDRIGSYFAFPAGAEQKAYPYYDQGSHTLGSAEYIDNERQIDGMSLYHYRFDSGEVDLVDKLGVLPTTQVQVPGPLLGREAGAMVVLDSHTRVVQDLWVEPDSGVVVMTNAEVRQYFADPSAPAVNFDVLTATFRPDDATAVNYADRASTGRFAMQLLRVSLPIGLGILAVLLLIAGVYFLRRLNRSTSSEGADVDDPNEPLAEDATL